MESIEGFIQDCSNDEPSRVELDIEPGATVYPSFCGCRGQNIALQVDIVLRYYLLIDI